MTTDDVIERQATGSDLFALPNAAMRSYTFHHTAMFWSKLH
jgi:hypothetical protein